MSETAATHKDELLRLVKGAHHMFAKDKQHHAKLSQQQLSSDKIKISVKISDEYAHVQHLPSKPSTTATTTQQENSAEENNLIDSINAEKTSKKRKREDEVPNAKALQLYDQQQGSTMSSAMVLPEEKALSIIAKRRRVEESQKPKWHPPWKLKKVLAGHMGWVRAIAVDHSNEWFASGGADRTIKIWDLASGTLKLSLMGHVSTIRDMVVSDRHPYFFSVGEDKMVKCWDLEQNKQVRHYHGHLSAVYCCALHPTLDILVTGGRDATVRVWDIRTKSQIFALAGHNDVVASVLAQSFEPQIISGSMDAMVRCWDLAAGKTRAILTHHKKAVRALALHPSEYTFASASVDNIKKWKCPETTFLHNFTGHHSIINSMAINSDNVLVSAADDGTMHFWDWKTGYDFFNTKTIPQPGSLDSEAGIFAAKFDQSGSRLITAEADKSIKIWGEDDSATPETHPVQYTYDPNPKKY